MVCTSRERRRAVAVAAAVAAEAVADADADAVRQTKVEYNNIFFFVRRKPT